MDLNRPFSSLRALSPLAALGFTLPVHGQSFVNGDFNSTSQRLSLGFSANLTTSHLDAGWVGNSANNRLFNTVTSTIDEFDPATARGNFRTLGGMGNTGYLVANDGSDAGGTSTVWNLSSGSPVPISGFSLDVIVKQDPAGGSGSASATTVASNSVQYALYGFRGTRAELDAAFPTTLVITTANTLDDPASRPGFTTLATGTLAAAATLNVFQNQTIPFSPPNQGAYDFYLIGFTAPAGSARGVGIDNIRLVKAPPSAPVGLTVTPTGATTVSISFEDTSEGEESFVLARRVAGSDTWTESMLSADSGTGIVTSTLAGLIASTDYEFRVRARNNGGDSAWSATATVTTPPPPPPPAAPANLTVTPANWFTLNLNFLDLADNEDGYVVSYRMPGSSAWTEVVVPAAAGSGGIVQAGLDELAANTSYEIRVRAINSGGVSDWSPVSLQNTPPAPKRPNIVLIIADDLGPDAVGAFGSELFAASTPRLDQLATSGMRFDRVFCSGICSPSRVQLLTGQYPFRNGCLDIDGSNFRSDPNKPSLLAMLRHAGYYTAGSGKDVVDPEMEEYLSGPTGGYWNVPAGSISKKGPTPVAASNYPYHPDALQAFTLDFLDRHVPGPENNHRPFYFQYGLINPHTPIVATPDSTPGETNAAVLYHDNIRYIDKVVGQVVDRLNSLGILDSTLVIFTGDNGSLGTYQSRVWDPKTSSFRSLHGGKADRVLYREGSALVPLILHWPQAIFGPRAGTLHRDLVDFTDFLPTFADLVEGVPDPGWQLDGQSFTGRIWKVPGYQPRDWIFSQLENNWYVRGENFRLNRDGRLYDMADAPFGMTEILPQNDTPESAAARSAFQALLDEFDPVNGPTYEAHQDNEWSNPAWAWKVANFNATERWETPTSGDRADPDNDGVPNIFERAFGWNPKNGTDTMPAIVPLGPGLTVSLPTFNANDTTITGESSETLQGWNTVTPTGSGPYQVTTEPSPSSSKIFLRLRANRTTPWNEP